MRLVRRDDAGSRDRWVGKGRNTYKELLGGSAERGLFRGGLHGGRHVHEVARGLLVELGLKGRQERIARHGPAFGAGAVGDGGRGQGGGGSSVAEGIVGGEEIGREAWRRPSLCR